MGLHSSRQAVIDIEAVTKGRTHKFYREPNYFPYKNDNGEESTLNLNTPTFKKHLLKAIEKIDCSELRILDPCAGNGASTKLITELIKTRKNEVSTKATDLCSYRECSYPVETGFPSEESVKVYGNDANVLLISSPPPNCYVDYYAIKEYEICKGEDKYIIYIGELGASDGGDGMYHYMMEHPHWKLLYRGMIKASIDVFGGACEKELFLFHWQ